MSIPDRPARGWSDLLPSRRSSVLLLIAALLIFVLPSFGTAQAPRRAASPLQTAARLLIEGRYDEAEAAADKLDQRDPNVVALKARAAIARGRYAAAEEMLRPAAQRAPTSEAALELGLLDQLLGHDGAVSTLEKVAALADASDNAAEVARGARALRALGRFQEANAAYRDAASAAPGDALIQTGWGDLFLEKYLPAEALKSYQDALAADPRWVPALIGSARALADDNPPKAIAFARQALAINPSAVDVEIFLAREAIDADHRSQARDELAKALAVNPSSLEAHALIAALDYVDDKEDAFDASVARTLAIAPQYGEVYRVAGDLAARNYRFDQAVALTRRALTLDPHNTLALGDLGLQLLRTGDETAARTALDASFKADPYSKLTFNLLKMMDGLDKFVTVKDADLVVRMHADEAPVLHEYAVAISHQALNTMSARYGFTAKGPILIEIFPKHDDFAVRTFGLPGMIGALGACFGRVVTMESPRAQPGEFQWEATLWHELAHVITLQMSNQRVPRWLTEGISVYEEKRARPEWGREMDVAFAGMLNRGETLKLHDLNAAFQDPKTISLAYYQASLLVDHLMTVYGQDGLNKLLRTYGQGLDTDAALKTALNTDLDQLQVGFDATVEKMFGTMRRAMAMPAGVESFQKMPTAELKMLADANPRSFPVQVALGRALRKDGQTDEAMKVYERAATLVPEAGGAGSPHEQMAAIALEKKDRPRTIVELTALVAVDFNNVDAARLLAQQMQLEHIDDPAKLQPVYQRIAAIDPFDPEAHAMLGRFALQRHQADDAAREFRAVIALGPVDRAAAYTDLAESYLEAGKKAEAKKQTLAALEIAPSYERAQGLLLKLVDK